MEIDKELLESFIEEISALNVDILEILKSLNENINQPEEFTKFSNFVDRIYGTATTLGFAELGEYTFALRTIVRQTGNSAIPRAMPPVFKLMMSYGQNFALLKQSVADPSKVSEFTNAIQFDMKKIERLQKDIFDFADKSNTMVKKGT